MYILKKLSICNPIYIDSCKSMLGAVVLKLSKSQNDLEGLYHIDGWASPSELQIQWV